MSALMRLLERFELLALGEVASDLRKPTKFSVEIVDRAQDDVGPEAGAVFAHPQSVDLHSAVSDYRREVTLGLTALCGFRGVETFDGAPDDFRRRVADDSFRAQVPACDAAVRVEHENRVFLDAVDEQSEALFAFTECFLVTAPLGEVARDLEEPGEVARRAAQGGNHHVGPETRAVLADAPALLLEASLPGGDLQFLAGPVPRNGVGGIEAGKVLADDFLGLVTLDVFGAGIPARDVAGDIEGKNGIVPDARHDLAEVPVHVRPFTVCGGLLRMVRAAMNYLHRPSSRRPRELHGLHRVDFRGLWPSSAPSAL